MAKVVRIATEWGKGEMKQNTYLVEFENECVVIDAGCPLAEIKELTKKPVVAVFVTHCHYDHIRYIEEYDKAGIKIYGHELTAKLLVDEQANISEVLGCSTKFKISNLSKIYERDQFMIDGHAIDCYQTPGHSLDGMCYIIDGELFSGDTVFSVAVGRTDLYNGNAQQLLNSLERVLELPFDKMYAGHGRVSNKDEQDENIYKWIKYLSKNASI